MKKRIVAIGLIAILLVSTLAGCSCSNSTTNNTTTTGYKCDFKNKDIAVPEGTKLTDNGLEVTDKADATVKNVLDIEKQLPAIIARDGEEPSPELKYMQETNAKKLRWNNYNAVADYTAETANQIDPTFGKVTEFGKDVFNVARAYYTGDVSAAISGVSGVLKLFGIFGSGGGVSNEQILMEVQKVYSAVQDVALDVKDLQGLTKAMSMELDETTMQAYRNGLQTFDNAMIALDTDAEIIQKMLVTGATVLQQQGVNAPAEDATDAERQEYIGKLIATMKEQQGSNPDLNNFDGLMTDLTNNYVLVAGELGKTNDFSPLKAYDNYWNMYFNWETQGYALREAYRGNAEFQVKRAYALIALYYNIGTANTASTYEQYGTLLANALDAIENNGPGVSPQVVSDNIFPYASGYMMETYDPEDTESFIKKKTYLEYRQRVYSSTFGQTLSSINFVRGDLMDDMVKARDAMVPKGTVDKYIEKLHGRTVLEDLSLAGVWPVYFYDTFELNGGLGFNFKSKDKKEYCDLLTNTEYRKDVIIKSNKNKDLSLPLNNGEGAQVMQFDFE